ncbi:MAG TPA: sulfate ABC transporter permease subunit [Anaerolineales bacterium]|nr:sulfate ABC transporter permease subunit [Anaerolineales bacterium]
MAVHKIDALRKKEAGRGPRVLILVVIAYVTFLVLAPITALIGAALQKGLPGFTNALAAPELWQAFTLSFEIAIGVIAIQGILGTITAWVIVRHSFHGKSLYNGIIDIPFAISPVVVGYILLLIFGRNGILNPLLQIFDWQVAFAVPGIFLATLFVSLPFMIREMIPVIQNLDSSQELAASTLGASHWTTFWRVIFPGLRTALFYGIALTMARAMGEFGAVLVIGGGVQGRTATTTLYIFHALEERQYVEAYTAAILLGLGSVFIVSLADFVRRRSQH